MSTLYKIMAVALVIFAVVYDVRVFATGGIHDILTPPVLALAGLVGAILIVTLIASQKSHQDSNQAENNTEIYRHISQLKQWHK